MKIEQLRTFIPESVKDLLKEVQDNMQEFDVYLGGGYCRDLYCGKQPKDVDIFLIPREGYIWEGRDYIPTETMVTYRKDTSDVEVASDMEARGVQGLVGLWCKRLRTTDVQYIIYKKSLTQEELSEDFDINLCQITYCVQSDSIHCTDAFLSGHKDKKIECLHSYDKKRTIARYKRMEKKFPDYEVVGKPKETIVEKTSSILSMLSGSSRTNAGSV